MGWVIRAVSGSRKVGVGCLQGQDDGDGDGDDDMRAVVRMGLM